MYQSPIEIDFSGFKKREALKNIWRYSLYRDVYYRSNVFDHSIRIFYMILALEKHILSIFPKIDFKNIHIHLGF